MSAPDLKEVRLSQQDTERFRSDPEFTKELVYKAYCFADLHGHGWKVVASDGAHLFDMHVNGDAFDPQGKQI